MLKEASQSPEANLGGPEMGILEPEKGTPERGKKRLKKPRDNEAKTNVDAEKERRRQEQEDKRREFEARLKLKLLEKQEEARNLMKEVARKKKDLAELQGKINQWNNEIKQIPGKWMGDMLNSLGVSDLLGKMNPWYGVNIRRQKIALSGGAAGWQDSSGNEIPDKVARGEGEILVLKKKYNNLKQKLAKYNIEIPDVDEPIVSEVKPEKVKPSPVIPEGIPEAKLAPPEIPVAKPALPAESLSPYDALADFSDEELRNLDMSLEDTEFEEPTNKASGGRDTDLSITLDEYDAATKPDQPRVTDLAPKAPGVPMQPRQEKKTQVQGQATPEVNPSKAKKTQVGARNPKTVLPTPEPDTYPLVPEPEPDTYPLSPEPVTPPVAEEAIPEVDVEVVDDEDYVEEGQEVKDHYETLGIDADATQEQIQEAYDNIDEKTEEVIEAYNVLLNPFSRQEYDESLGIIDRTLQEGGEWVRNEDGTTELLTKAELEKRSLDRLKREMAMMETVKEYAKTGLRTGFWGAVGAAAVLGYEVVKNSWKVAKITLRELGHIGWSVLTWNPFAEQDKALTSKDVSGAWGRIKENWKEFFPPKEKKKESEKKA